MHGCKCEYVIVFVCNCVCVFLLFLLAPRVNPCLMKQYCSPQILSNLQASLGLRVSFGACGSSPSPLRRQTCLEAGSWAPAPKTILEQLSNCGADLLCSSDIPSISLHTHIHTLIQTLLYMATHALTVHLNV